MSNDVNKTQITNLVAKARKRGWFPVTKGLALPVVKCPKGCGMSSITFRNKKGQEKKRCFRCGK